MRRRVGFFTEKLHKKSSRIIKQAMLSEQKLESKIILFF